MKKHIDNCTRSIANPAYDKNCPRCMEMKPQDFFARRTANGDVVYSYGKNGKEKLMTKEEEQKIRDFYFGQQPSWELSLGEVITHHDANTD